MRYASLILHSRFFHKGIFSIKVKYTFFQLNYWRKALMLDYSVLRGYFGYVARRGWHGMVFVRLTGNILQIETFSLQ